MVDLLMPSADNLYANVASNHMAPFAWFTGHNSEVTADLNTLSSHAWDDNQYIWQTSLGSRKFRSSLRRGIPHWGYCPALDYLIMTDLVKGHSTKCCLYRYQ